MIDLLYSYNLRLSRNHRIFEKTRLNSIGRHLLRYIANSLLPLYLTVTKGKSMKEIGKEVLPIVVSFTSFPVRIGKVWMVVEAMLRQQRRPELIVLWLSRDQFPNELSDLPQQLVEQQTRGLEIRFVEGDIRSHKKYYYAFTEFKDKYVLTIDDDLLFPSTFVGDVYDCVKRHPNSVIANFGSRFRWNEKIGYLDRTDYRIQPDETGKNLFFGSGGGTLFQPDKLLPYMDDIETIWNLCPTADDIYLNSLVHLARMDVTFMGVFPLLSITNDEDVKLTDYNGNLYSPTSTNAGQLRALVMYCRKIHGSNPFEA